MMKKARNIRYICVVYHPQKKEARSAATELVEWLNSAKIKTFTSAHQRTIKGTQKIAGKRGLDKLDLVVVLGGDGTYLGAVRMLEGRSVPVLGVNLGSLGFLTETRIEDLYRVMDLVLQNQMILRPRSMLEVTLIRKENSVGCYRALNEIVIERGPVTQLLNMAVLAGNSLITELKADGLIVATPSGSTAYNLAAGGPIVHPDVAAIVITPVCPHSLTNRPITIPDNIEITLKVNSSTQKAVLMVDGLRVQDIDDRDIIKIRRAPEVHYMLSVPTIDYFDVLKTKLNFGQRN